MKDYSVRLTFRTSQDLYNDLSVLCALDAHFTFNDFLNKICRDYVARTLTPEKRAALDLVKNSDSVG